MLESKEGGKKFKKAASKKWYEYARKSFKNVIIKYNIKLPYRHRTENMLPLASRILSKERKRLKWSCPTDFFTHPGEKLVRIRGEQEFKAKVHSSYTEEIIRSGKWVFYV